ncbi:MAK10-like protein [Tanacetum coccineum]
MNIVTRKAYNTIMVEGLESTGKNFVAIVRDVYVSVGRFTYSTIRNPKKDRSLHNGIAIHMLTEKKYPLSQEMSSNMLKKKLEVDHESSQAFELLRLGDKIDQGVGSTLFKKLNIGLLEDTDHIFGLVDKTKSYPIRIVKDVEVHIGKLKLLNDFYVLDMKKYPETPLLVGRGILATANAVIDCRMAKIAVGEGITRLIFGVKGVDLGEEEVPYWTTLRKRESYKPRPRSNEIGAKPPYYTRKDFLDCHLPGEWEISRDVELNPFKDTLVFRRMVEFLGAIPINLKCNMWESEDLIKNLINWGKPPKNEDGAWHAKIRLINPDEEDFTKTLQSIPTTRNSLKEKVQERSST